MTSSTKLSTEIMEVIPDDIVEPEYKTNVRGLFYLEDYDGVIEPNAMALEIPQCTIDSNTEPQYQCIKCGNKQSNYVDIHRMKCSKCYNKAFNKIRPTKWVKFRAY